MYATGEELLRERIDELGAEIEQLRRELNEARRALRFIANHLPLDPAQAAVDMILMARAALRNDAE